MGSLPAAHFAIFPFMAQGHTIPLLYLSRLLRHRSIAVTIFTTAANSPPIRAYLKDTDVSIVELPFPQNIDGVPPGVENTHKLPSMSYFLPFLQSTKLMQKSFDHALQSLHPPVTCIISDMFLGFTLQSANKIGVPRLAFNGMGAFSSVMCQILGRDKPHAVTESADEQFVMTDFPEWKLTRNDFEFPFCEIEPSGPHFEFIMEQVIAMAMSHGEIVNSFYELEKRYVDYSNRNLGLKSWCVGPLREAAPPPLPEIPSYIRFLDERLAEGKGVLYVAFGTQAEVSEEQLREIGKGLEESGVCFLWALKAKGGEFVQNYEGRGKNGMVVTDWVEQLQILNHEGTKGFLSHCGWNSVMESISAGVPILALPFMADQHLNARFVVEELGGLRIMPVGGSVRGFVAAEEVERKVREMMSGEEGAAARRKAAEYGCAASEAVKESGSSMRTLDLLIDELSGLNMCVI